MELFRRCLNKTSNIFIANAGIFGKVYFPRLVVPLSIVVSNIIQFGIQFGLFLCFLLYYLATGSPIAPNWLWIPVLAPALILLMAALALSTAITAVLLFVGVVIFNKVEKTFMDTV